MDKRGVIVNDLNLICFLFLARTKNLSSTAKELCLSEHTVMRNIEKPEEEFQVSLFQKDIGRVKLTAAGEYYYDVSRKFESKLTATLLDLNNPKSREVLHLVWSSWSGCPKWLKSAIYQYAQEHQKLDIRLISDTINDIPELFERREVDVVFSSMYMSRCLNSSHHTARMGEIPVFLAVSRHHLLSDSKKVSPKFASFVNLTVAMGDETREDTIKRVNEFHVPFGYLPKQIAVYDNWNSVYIDVALGNGICITPQNEILEGNENITLIPTGRTVTLTASWINTTANRHVRSFMDFVHAEREKANE